MNIRFADKKDIPKLLVLLNTLFHQEKEFTPNNHLQTLGLTQIIENDNIGKIVLIEKEERIIGMVNLLFSISTALGAKVAILEDMVVLEEYRGKKVGTKLLKFAIEYLKENEFKRVTLLTDFDNLDAQNFYKKLGFKQSSMIPFRLLLD